MKRLVPSYKENENTIPVRVSPEAKQFASSAHTNKKSTHKCGLFFILVRGDFLNWNTLEKEILRWKYIFTSRTIPEFTENELAW